MIESEEDKLVEIVKSFEEDFELTLVTDKVKTFLQRSTVLNPIELIKKEERMKGIMNEQRVI